MILIQRILSIPQSFFVDVPVFECSLYGNMHPLRAPPSDVYSEGSNRGARWIAPAKYPAQVPTFAAVGCRCGKIFYEKQKAA